ncbi:hypothetical protein ACFQ0X_17435 [Streptomyces rectiviolaceus]|uniref:ABC transporter permease n=1 Tax=Streptomyces rectiviolaceus TaxID=332591 RepID=A0ABP6MNU5_9ACTN
MKILTRLRTSGAIWMSPVCLGIILVYFFQSLHLDPGYTGMYTEPKWGPSVVSRVLIAYYAFSYAIASGLGAWEAGRLKRDGVWSLSAARSRYRIAAEALLPGVAAGWLMLLIPLGMAFAEIGTWPTIDSLPLLGMGMILVCVHSIIGFAVGSRLNRIISAPLIAAVTYFLIGGSASRGETLWTRHLSGQFTAGLSFGEIAPLESLLPHILFSGSIAAACCVAWISAWGQLMRIAIRITAAAACVGIMASCVAAVDSWGAVSPLASGHAATECRGTHPRVCAPAAAHLDMKKTQREIAGAITALREAGVDVPTPSTVNDSVVLGRVQRTSTDRVWWMPVSKQAARGEETLRLAAVAHAVQFPCNRTDAVNSRSAMLWAATVAGADRPYLTWQKSEVQQYANGDEVLEVVQRRVSTARKLSHAEQSAWYAKEIKKACTNAGKDGT